MTVRRLAAIVAVDVAGYSRLMHADEEATHVQFTRLMSEAVEPALAAHGGRMVKSTGDGFLAEFGSAVEAVKCARQFQSSATALSESQPDHRRIRFRVGIHLGDVLVEPHDVFGDGVNIAARLEALAEPGGILVSGAVHDTVRGRLDCEFEDRGEQKLKNIDRAIRVYGAGPSPAPSRTTVEITDRPSIAVLPFQNVSGDPEQEYFADGLVDEIITALSRVNWFLVISRSSSSIYKGRVTNVKQVSRELGVRYVLEGSIRRAAQRLRITGQLIDAVSGRQLWADRFEGELADIFALQDRLTESVVGAIEPNVLKAEVRRAQLKPTGSLDAYDLYLRTAPLLHTRTRASIDAGVTLLHRALSIDPSFSAAKGALAYAYALRSLQGWAEPADIERVIALSRDCAAQAWGDPTTLAKAGYALAVLTEEREEGVALVRRAMRVNPNSSLVLMLAGFTHCAVGQPEPAIECLSRALVLNPLGPEVAQVDLGLGLAHLFADRLPEALEFTERAMHTNSDWHPTLRFRIAVLVHAGRLEEARALARRLLTADPAFRVSTRHLALGPPAMRDLYKNALLDAGLPE